MMFPLRAIHQIELTSRCNLKCAYCPSYRLPRPKVDMAWSTLERTLAVARALWGVHRHGELNMAGIGESTMHARFVDAMFRAREVMGPEVSILLATNGLLMTREMARAIAPMRPSVYVSLHRPEKAQHAVQACAEAGILTAVSCDGAMNAVNWAGQVDWPVTTPTVGQNCDWVVKGRAFVLADGRLSRCCFDADGSGVFGHVDDDLSKAYTSPYHLCATCHLKQPASVVEVAA
jgi:hypothetical protein